MIDPWIAIVTNMVMFGGLGILLQYASRDIFTEPVDYVASSFIMAIVGGTAGALAWGLTRMWA